MDHFPNLVALFFARVAEKGDQPFLSIKRDGRWQALSWREAAERVAALAEAARRVARAGAGAAPGDTALARPAASVIGAGGGAAL